MNRFFLKQRSFEYPDAIEHAISDVNATCVSFNSRGTLLACGTGTGNIIVIDFDSRSIVRNFVCHNSSITSLSWFKKNTHLISIAANCLIILDVSTGAFTLSVTFDEAITCAEAHPKLQNILVISCQESHYIFYLDSKIKKKVEFSNISSFSCFDFSYFSNDIWFASQKSQIVKLNPCADFEQSIYSSFVLGSGKILNLRFMQNEPHVLILTDKMIRVFDTVR